MRPRENRRPEVASRVMCSGLAGSILILAAAALPASGDTWDFETDFSTNSNPNGVWSYRWQSGGTARDGNYALMANKFVGSGADEDVNGWWRGDHPLVAKNFSTTVTRGGYSPGIAPTQSCVHPGNLYLAVVRWTAPAGGWYNITYRFKDQNAGGGNGIIWYIDRNTATLAAFTMVNGGDTSNAYVTAGERVLSRIQISAGDHINFIVDPNGNYSSDSTRVLARIETTTAPPVMSDYDLERDFDVGTNDTGVWSYRYQSDGSPDNRARDGSYELLPDANTFDPYFQGYAVPGGLPRISKFFGSSTYTSGGYSVGAGETDVHPNPNQIVVAQWTAPGDGTYDIAYRVRDENTGGGNGIRWYMDKGSSSGVLAAGSIADGGDTDDRTLNRVTVATGDKINFIVDPNGADHGWDSTRVKVAISPSGSAPTDYDLDRDFRITPGMNTDTTRWSYRYKTSTTRDGNYSLMTSVDDTTGSWPYWYNSGSVGRNYGNNISYGGTTIPPGAVVAHPPNDNQITVVSWLAPDSGRATITYQFNDHDTGGGNGVKWYVDQNPGLAAGSTLASGTIANGGDSGSQTLTNVAVTAGDRINFIVDPNGNYGWDQTRVRATISYAPQGAVFLFR